jgi:hypothetical protein
MGVTSQLSRITLTAKGSLTSASAGQNYECYPKTELGGGKKCEYGQYFAVSSRQGVCSVPRS